MRRVFWDTMLFVYWLENHPTLGERVGTLYTGMERRGDTLCTSLFVLGEVLVGPMKRGDSKAVKTLEDLFRTSTLLLPYPATAARTFATLRAEQGVKSLDALHLATAAAAGVDTFLTNDRRLRNVVVPGIGSIASIDSESF